MRHRKETIDDFIKRFRKIENPEGKKCPECGSKDMFYDSSAGPIVGGVGDWKHPPNAHPVGAWICLNCIEREKQLAKENKVCKICGLSPEMCICNEIDNEVKLRWLLTCQICNKPFKKIDEHTYEPDCSCIKKKLRISVG